MAIQEQVEILRQGADAWNQWRAQHTDVVTDLSGADFSKANFGDVNLSKVNFGGVDLGEANIGGLNVSGEVVFGGTNLRRANFRGANLGEANFRGVDLGEVVLWGANLEGANLSCVTLYRADLSGANLTDANLSSSYLYRADLNGANLEGANLRRADLTDAALNEAILIGANFTDADLNRTDLNGSHLYEANFTGATVASTYFGDLDLRTVKGLETIRHTGPSYISTSTLERSQVDIPEVFLRGAGLSDTFIEYVRSLVARPIEYYTCFLSYSRKDQDIAERLYADLQSKGVRCWYAPHELKPGDYYRHKIDESIRTYDKLVLILSLHSVESEWVEKEVETALKKEESMDMIRQVLFPLRLDNAALQSRRAWVRSLRYHRHIGDFTGWKDHDTYQVAFQRLLNDLKAEPVKKSG